MWGLGIELRTSAKAARFFNHRATSPTPMYFNLYKTEAVVICELLHQSKFVLSTCKLESHISSSSHVAIKYHDFSFFCNIEDNLKNHKLISVEISVGLCDITLPRFQMNSPGTVNNGWARSQIQEKFLNNSLLASLCYIPHRYNANWCAIWHLLLWWNTSYYIYKKNTC